MPTVEEFCRSCAPQRAVRALLSIPGGMLPRGDTQDSDTGLFALQSQDTTLRRAGHTHTEQRLLAGIFHPHHNLRSGATAPEQPGMREPSVGVRGGTNSLVSC